MTGRVTRSVRTTRSAGCRWSTRAPRSRRRTGGGPTSEWEPGTEVSTMTTGYAPIHETPEGKVFTVTGADWEEVLAGRDPIDDEKIIVNRGPQHPSTHGVLRLVLELEWETITQCRAVDCCLHTGIEGNLECCPFT